MVKIKIFICTIWIAAFCVTISVVNLTDKAESKIKNYTMP